MKLKVNKNFLAGILTVFILGSVVSVGLANNTTDSEIVSEPELGEDCGCGMNTCDGTQQRVRARDGSCGCGMEQCAGNCRMQ